MTWRWALSHRREGSRCRGASCDFQCFIFSIKYLYIGIVAHIYRHWTLSSAYPKHWVGAFEMEAKPTATTAGIPLYRNQSAWTEYNWSIILLHHYRYWLIFCGDIVEINAKFTEWKPMNFDMQIEFVPSGQSALVLLVIQRHMRRVAKFHNATIRYPTMHHFVTEMCKCVHISVTIWCIVGYLSNASWDLYGGSD